MSAAAPPPAVPAAAPAPAPVATPTAAPVPAPTTAAPAGIPSAPVSEINAEQYLLEKASKTNAELHAKIADLQAQLAAAQTKENAERYQFENQRISDFEREEARRAAEEQARIDKLEELRFAPPGYARPGYAPQGYAGPGYATAASGIAAAAGQTDWWFYGIVVVLIGIAIWWMWSSGLLSNLFKGVNDVVKDATSAVQGAFGFGSSIVSTGASAATAIASDVTHPIGTAVHVTNAIGSEATHIGDTISSGLGHIF